MAKGTLTAEFELPQRVDEENVAASRVPLHGALPKRSSSRNLDVHEVEWGRRARDVGGGAVTTLPAGRDLRHGDSAQVLRPDLAMEEAADDLVGAEMDKMLTDHLAPVREALQWVVHPHP
jgi:hypothetical protein